MSELLMKVSVAARVGAVFATVATFAGTGMGGAAVVRTADTGLTLAVSGPARVGVNDRYSYTVTVANRRTDSVAAHGVAVVSSYYTSGLESWSGVQGAACTGLGDGRASCAVGDVPAGSTRSFTVTLTASRPGNDSRTFVATSDNDPTTTATGTYTTTIVPPAPPPTPPKIVPSLALRRAGSTMTFVLTVKNMGPGTMHNITVQDRYDYPDVEIKPPSGCQTKPYYVTCKIARLAQGTSTTLRLVAHINSSDARTATRFLDVINIAFPWRTNTSGFQENSYTRLTKPTNGR
jgi:hypothetical protein